MSAIAVIPAKGTSARIPNKNRRIFHGRPILEYSIEAARDSGIFDDVLVSTDDPAIELIALENGAGWIRRPPELCLNEIGTQEVMRHAVGGMSADYACCIYATAPMLDPHDLIKALQQLKRNASTYVVPIGEWLSDPGMFYFGMRGAFTHPLPLIGAGTELMQVDPRRCIDINTPEDWTRAERMYEELHRGD